MKPFTEIAEEIVDWIDLDDESLPRVGRETVAERIATALASAHEEGRKKGLEEASKVAEGYCIHSPTFAGNLCREHEIAKEILMLREKSA